MEIIQHGVNADHTLISGENSTSEGFELSKLAGDNTNTMITKPLVIRS